MTVAVEGFGEVTVDISYGGAFYAFVSAQRFGLDVNQSMTRDLVDAATAVTNAVKSQVGSLCCLCGKQIVTKFVSFKMPLILSCLKAAEARFASCSPPLPRHCCNSVMLK